MHSLLKPLHTLTCIALLLAMSILSLPAQSASNTPTQAVDAGPIVVTIKPLYSLVAQLTDGIEKPVLLMSQMASPHHYSMRPSERRLLSNARMIVWIGPQMETYLYKVINQQQAVIVTAMQAQGLTLLEKRARDGHQHAADEHSHDDQPDDMAIDPHIWLSTQNAIAMSRHINRQLIASDPENSAHYQQNLEHLISRITQLSAEIRSDLKDSQQPYITYHDAFQYFEAENQLNFIGSISLDEETGASLKHLREIRTRIEEKNVQCLLYQPPRPDIVGALAEQTRIRTAPIDPLGQTIKNLGDAWFLIMRSTTENIRQCLKT